MSANFQTPEWESNSNSEKIILQLQNGKPTKTKSQKKKNKLKALVSTSLNIKKAKNKGNANKASTPDKKPKKTKTKTSNVLAINPTNVDPQNETKSKTKRKKNKIKILSEIIITPSKKPKSSQVNSGKSSKSPKLSVKTNSKAEKALKTPQILINGKPEASSLIMKRNKFKEKLKNAVQTKPTTKTLRARMLEQLKSARFRYINEQLYTSESLDAVRFFQEEPDAFGAYHQGYRQQVSKWPMNPLDKIINNIKKMPKELIIGDFGCGEAKLALSVPQKVNSFDLIAANEDVIECDISKTPLENGSLDIAVYCLSLMSTNLVDIIMEANRVLKIGGIMKVAEVESRFDTVEIFIAGMERFGFKLIHKDMSHNLFYFLDFRKERTIKNKNKLPTISLHPCMYKKR